MMLSRLQKEFLTHRSLYRTSTCQKLGVLGGELLASFVCGIELALPFLVKVI